LSSAAEIFVAEFLLAAWDEVVHAPPQAKAASSADRASVRGKCLGISVRS